MDDAGYAFLFFYGLERRLLVEQQDQGPILKEVVRLLETQNVSGSFNEYLNQFLAFSLARLEFRSTDDQLFRAIFEKRRVKWDESLMAVAFAWLYKMWRSIARNVGVQGCSRGILFCQKALRLPLRPTK